MRQDATRQARFRLARLRDARRRAHCGWDRTVTVGLDPAVGDRPRPSAGTALKMQAQADRIPSHRAARRSGEVSLGERKELEYRNRGIGTGVGGVS
jgi:hypothetical protein